jgi:hypothetical protein
MVVNTYYYDNNDRLGIDETVKMINIIQILYKYKYAYHIYQLGVAS